MTFYRYWFAFKIILIIAGICWCVTIFQRRHQDLEDFKQNSDPADRYIVVGYWVTTAIIASLLIAFVPGEVKRLLDFFRW